MVWLFTVFGSGWMLFFLRSTVIGTSAFVGMTLASLAQRKVEKEVQRVRMDLHRTRGEAYSPPTPGRLLASSLQAHTSPEES